MIKIIAFKSNLYIFDNGILNNEFYPETELIPRLISFQISGLLVVVTDN